MVKNAKKIGKHVLFNVSVKGGVLEKMKEGHNVEINRYTVWWYCCHVQVLFGEKKHTGKMQLRGNIASQLHFARIVFFCKMNESHGGYMCKMHLGKYGHCDYRGNVGMRLRRW